MFISESRKQRLSKLLSLAEKKFNRGPSKRWKNKDFEDLSFSIHLETKILISSGTLKRVFGKVETSRDYFPQDATITALEVYTGYELFPTMESPKTDVKKRAIQLVLSVLLLALGGASIFVFFPSTSKLPIGELSLSKIDGNSPATVYFDYQFTTTDDSVFISFGDDSEPSFLRNEKGKVSHYYRYPGRFSSYLTTRSNSISPKINFFIPTENWQVLASYFDQPYTERYFPVPLEKNCKDGVFQLTNRFVSSIGMDTTKIVVIRLDNYQKTDYDGDSFTLKTKLSNGAFWPAIRCYSAFLRVAGEKGDIFFKFVNSGCSQFSEFAVGEKNHLNYPVDLIPFSIKMSEWNTFQIDNNDKHVVVKVNDVVVFEDSYLNSIGYIIGSTIKFHGIGSVDYFYLTDSTGAAIISEDF